jgi:drug/metabolite transporter (DMT)-like permease
VRSILAGALLYAVGRLLGGAAPPPRAWRAAFGIGGLLFLGGHGGLFWALGHVPSGVAAVLFATIPLWMTAAQAITDGAAHLTLRTAIGLLGGGLGVVVLIGPGLATGPRVDPLGAVVALLAAASWSAGSAWSRRSESNSLAVATGSSLLAGGALLAAAALVGGEAPNLSAASITPRSIAALGYLVLFGSVLAFGAYSWLLRHASLTAVSTYAYVNPVVALLLGWLVLGEPLGTRVIGATLLVLCSVALILGTPVRALRRRDA